MKLRIVLAATVALLIAQPALSDLRSYDTGGDQSTEFPTDGTVFRPGTNSGETEIDINVGAGATTLVKHVVTNAFLDIVGGTSTTNIPGTTVTLDSITKLTIAAGQTGTTAFGGSGGTITFGSLSGWTQTGRLNCTTHCPPGDCFGASSCIPFVGFEGTGPPAPLKDDSFNVDGWVLTGAGLNHFDVSSFEIVNLGLGAVTANVLWTGWSFMVPAVPLAGVAGLGAALVYLGARAIRRKSR